MNSFYKPCLRYWVKATKSFTFVLVSSNHFDLHCSSIDNLWNDFVFYICTTHINHKWYIRYDNGLIVLNRFAFGIYDPGKIYKIEEKILILWNKFVNQCKFYLGTVPKRWSYKEVSVLNEFILKPCLHH